MEFGLQAGVFSIFDLNTESSDLDPWSTQAGLEFRSPKTFFGNTLRPVACVDIQNRQENYWNADISGGNRSHQSLPVGILIPNRRHLAPEKITNTKRGEKRQGREKIKIRCKQQINSGLPSSETDERESNISHKLKQPRLLPRTNKSA